MSGFFVHRQWGMSGGGEVPLGQNSLLELRSQKGSQKQPPLGGAGPLAEGRQTRTRCPPASTSEMPPGPAHGRRGGAWGPGFLHLLHEDLLLQVRPTRGTDSLSPQPVPAAEACMSSWVVVIKLFGARRTAREGLL